MGFSGIEYIICYSRSKAQIVIYNIKYAAEQNKIQFKKKCLNLIEVQVVFGFGVG